ncbi:putative inner dynein arm light chain [Besnoitia besnoiti]|uniref:Putative inner dynein arm light chain n=1 Tax=Besnoitia besnoiti TaxID=94643 RepID=A0A2A9MJ79_BESBE|nr:putative inner dynein arm light chain [Besnoitia besnoiti]PFH38025.1 putative inner dynein arm light chain [Besnoitia besnoiti]
MQTSLLKYRTPHVERIISKDASKNRSRAKGSGDGPAAQHVPIATTEDILDSILPPREWTENGQLWRQRVSSTPATRADVIALQEELDKRLQQRQAREYGLCSIREKLYSQCFDEILRQVTIACAERGLLLHRVRTELRTMIQAYQKLYGSSAAFGMRKALQAEQRKDEMDQQLEFLTRSNRQLEQEVNVMERYVEKTIQDAKERMEQEEQDHRATVMALKKKSQKMRHELERLLSVSTRR